MEAKLEAQSNELSQRAKIIEELKTSLSIYIDKYNKLKVDFEKEKQYGINVSLGLKNSQRKKSTKKSFGPLRITHFSAYYPKAVPRKKTSKPKSANELKELKIKYDKLKQEKENNENEWNINLNKLKVELEEANKKFSRSENEIAALLKKQKEEESSSLTTAKKLSEEIQQKEAEIKKITEKLNALTKDKDKEAVENSVLKKELEKLRTQESNQKQIMITQKEEINRLKVEQMIKFQKTKEENDDLMNQIASLNDKLVSLDFKKKTRENSQKDYKMVKTNSVFVTSNVMNKTFEKKMALQKNEISGLAQKNKELSDTISKLKQASKAKDKKMNVYLNEIKEHTAKIYENCNIFILKTEQKCKEKLGKFKERMDKIKKALAILGKTGGASKNEKIMRSMISKLETDKEKLMIKINNLDLIIKELDKKNTQLEGVVKAKEKEFLSVQTEYAQLKGKYSELDQTRKELLQKLEMYIVENNGKSKIIDERNEEIKKLKNMLK